MKAALRPHALLRSPAFPFLLLAFALGPIGLGAIESLASWGVLALPDLPGLPGHRMSLTAIALSLLVAPLMEELAFRAAIQDYLSHQRWAQKQWCGLSVPNVLTSVLFAACHIPTHSLALALLTFFPSLVFGKAKEASGRLRWSIALHAWFNLCFIWHFF
ncbi:JDVT-CTERM system glutamic-type intramembrane protease MrtJ [Variovorax sp. HJSM1_2]|uniref:JDVT-CTERM system glutamic-type intramembrane protease MrtJ n=1 Tax=Variovorax sp. HJSM1_2 TaxID=3366263 RepID=UPI003BE0580A